MDARVTQDRLERLRGNPVCDRDGDLIGYLEEVFYDNATQLPEWLGVAAGFLGTKLVIVPIAGARAGADGLTVAYSRGLVEAAPDLCNDELDEETENELTAHYGLASRATPRAGVAGIPGFRRRS
jgi:PRC-barrel domain